MKISYRTLVIFLCSLTSACIFSVFGWRYFLAYSAGWLSCWLWRVSVWADSVHFINHTDQTEKVAYDGATCHCGWHHYSDLRRKQEKQELEELKRETLERMNREHKYDA
jgi:hypothetical protein